MKAFLLYQGQDFDLLQQLPPQAQTLTQDLELNTLFNAMARGDALVFEVAKKVVLSNLTDLDTILYRQQILQDCLNNAPIVREMYTLAGEAIAGEKKVWGFWRDYPSGILRRSVDVLEMFVGINLVANALAQSTDHILSFFTMLRTELAFYVGCLNLREQLTQKGAPIYFPVPAPSNERKHTFHGLYDACLVLTMKRRIVGNTVHADGKELVIITGANQGGKSTFLRSIGLAQLMMQCGMFVPAESFAANSCERLFTHFKRKEDATMKSGKLDEELSRMSEIVEQITAHSLVLFNESFAATNEREGSEIARRIIGALVEKRMKVFFVTHLYTFAHGVSESDSEDTLFLRADRQAGGSRTFQLLEGEPLETSYGEDVYQRIFRNDP